MRPKCVDGWHWSGRHTRCGLCQLEAYVRTLRDAQKTLATANRSLVKAGIILARLTEKTQ
jgi:hypothetical protein